jgi:hypothetical protein
MLVICFLFSWYSFLADSENASLAVKQFSSYDIEGFGHISPKDFLKYITELKLTKRVTLEEAVLLVKDLDTHSDGRIFWSALAKSIQLASSRQVVGVGSSLLAPAHLNFVLTPLTCNASHTSWYRRSHPWITKLLSVLWMLLLIKAIGVIRTGNRCIGPSTTCPKTLYSFDMHH